MALPGAIGTDVQRQGAMAANVGRIFNEAISRATTGLRWAPLDWQLYFVRALGKVGAQRPVAEAVDDFRRARFLEPNSFDVPYQEGVAWLATQPTLAMTAWREALRRAGAQRSELYDRMLSVASQRSPTVSRMLEQFGSVEPDLALAFLGRAQGEHFATALNRLIAHDASLSSLTMEQRAKLFALWAERGDLARLAAFAAEEPERLAEAWRGVAKFHADRNEFRQAYELAQRFSARPALPPVPAGSSIEQLQNSSAANPGNYGVGFALYHLQTQAGKIDDALLTLRRFTSQADCPAYFHFIEAEAWAAKGNWERAWQAWEKFEAPHSK